MLPIAQASAEQCVSSTCTGGFVLAKPPCAGEMIHSVAFQSPPASSDSEGGFSGTWTTNLTVKVAIKPVTGRELSLGDKRTATITHEIWMRYVPGRTVTPKQRIIYGSRIFQVRAVINVDEHNEWFRILCEEGEAT